MTVSILTRDPELQDALVHAVERLGYEARELDGPRDVVTDASVTAAILDDGLPDLGSAVEAFRQRLPRAGLVVLSGLSGASDVVGTLGLGVDEVLRKPFDLPGLASALRSATRLSRPSPAPPVVAQDERMRALLRRLDRAASTDLTITLAGEMGTGKSLLARWLHGRSRRGSAPFVEISALELDTTSCLADLWGDSAHGPSRPGRMEQAHGGTLVLDGIDDFPQPAQEALLALLQGERCEIDARVIAIVRRPLDELARGDALCEPLFCRLQVMQVEIPPLRERPDDVPALGKAFLARFAREEGQPVARLGPAVTSSLRSRPWRGNVRELENLMARAALAFSGAEVELEWIEDSKAPTKPSHTGLNLQQLERAAIARSLHLVGGRRTEAARALGISVRTLRNKIRKYQLT